MRNAAIIQSNLQWTQTTKKSQPEKVSFSYLVSLQVEKVSSFKNRKPANESSSLFTINKYSEGWKILKIILTSVAQKVNCKADSVLNNFRSYFLCPYSVAFSSYYVLEEVVGK